MSYKKILKAFLNDVKELLFPKKCAVCSCIIKNGILCESCLKTVKFIHEPSCRVCAMPKSRCRCRSSEEKRAFKAAAAVFEYDEGSSRIIHNFKFYGKKYIADFLAEYMASRCRESFGETEFSAVAYVPMSGRKERERGFNQSELLALKIAGILNVPCKKLLSKTGKSRVQHTLSRRERMANVRGIYSANSGEDCAGKTVLLVDDVFTTGSTANECAGVLLAKGAKEVFVLCAAVSSLHEERRWEKRQNI